MGQDRPSGDYARANGAKGVVLLDEFEALSKNVEN